MRYQTVEEAEQAVERLQADILFLRMAAYTSTEERALETKKVALRQAQRELEVMKTNA